MMNRIVHENRVTQYFTQYYGIDRILVEERANNVVRSIDPYRSPKRTYAYQIGKNWCVDVEWYNIE